MVSPEFEAQFLQPENVLKLKIMIVIYFCYALSRLAENVNINTLIIIKSKKLGRTFVHYQSLSSSGTVALCVL